MKQALRRKIETFVEENIVLFHSRRIENLHGITLPSLLSNKNPYLFKAKNLNYAADLITALLEARLSSSEEGSFGGFLEELAIFVARITMGGQKSGIAGIDIEVTRDATRYLIAVKSGQRWGNADQHRALRKHFNDAVRVIKQSRQAGALQPTLGICYGKFKTVHNGEYLRIGGQSFWHLISDDPNLYVDIVEPLGHDAERHNASFQEEKAKTHNRLISEFVLGGYCDRSFAIDWTKVVGFVSKNLPEPTS